MIAKQQFDHRLASLTHLVAVSGNYHALGDDSGAGRLELRHLLDLDDAHAASALERKVWVIAEGWHFDARGFAGLNQQRPGRCRDLLSVDSKCYIRHLWILYASTGCCSGVPVFSNGQGLPSR